MSVNTKVTVPLGRSPRTAPADASADALVDAGFNSGSIMSQAQAARCIAPSSSRLPIGSLGLALVNGEIAFLEA
jgi:hypothetical protein